MAGLSPTSSPGRARGLSQVPSFRFCAREAKTGIDRDEEGVRCVLRGFSRKLSALLAYRAHRRVDGRVSAHHDDGRVVLGGA